MSVVSIVAWYLGSALALAIAVQVYRRAPMSVEDRWGYAAWTVLFSPVFALLLTLDTGFLMFVPALFAIGALFLLIALIHIRRAEKMGRLLERIQRERITPTSEMPNEMRGNPILMFLWQSISGVPARITSDIRP